MSVTIKKGSNLTPKASATAGLKLFVLDTTDTTDSLAGTTKKIDIDALADYFLVPITSYTTSQRNALTPVEKQQIYNTTTDQYEFYNGSSWLPMTSGVASSATIEVIPGLDPELNGDKLVLAIAAAAALTPNGAAKSATNRASVLVYPGVYEIDSDTNGPILLNTQFVDIIGIDKKSCIITDKDDASNTIVRQTANDIMLKNLTFKAVFEVQFYNGGSTNAATVYENCYFHSFGEYVLTEHAGTYYNCESQNALFGGTDGLDGTYFSGKAYNCTGGNESFACLGTFSGYAENCYGAAESFGGGGGSMTGKMINCKMDTNEWNSTVSGFLRRCTITSGATKPVIQLLAVGAYIDLCTFKAGTGATYSITHTGGSVTISILRTALNAAINTGAITNDITTPYNVIDANVE